MMFNTSQKQQKMVKPKTITLKASLCKATSENRNGRVYPSEVIAKEVKRYNKEFVEKKRAFGELGHPNGPTINLDRVSHMITDLHQEGSNFVGKAKIMDTPMGKVVKILWTRVLHLAFLLVVWVQ